MNNEKELIVKKEKMNFLSWVSSILLIIAIGTQVISSLINKIFFVLRWKQLDYDKFFVITIVSFAIGFIIALINFITSDRKKYPKIIFALYIITVVWTALSMLGLFLIFKMFFELLIGIISSLP